MKCYDLDSGQVTGNEIAPGLTSTSHDFKKVIAIMVGKGKDSYELVLWLILRVVLLRF